MPRRWWPTPAAGQRVRGHHRRIRRAAHAPGQALGRPGSPRCARTAGRSWPRTRRRRTCTTSCSFWGDGVPNGGTVRWHRQVRRRPGRALPRHGEHQCRWPAGCRGARRLDPGAWRRGQHRAEPGCPVPDDRDPLRLHRSRVGAHRRDPGRPVRRRVRPALRPPPYLRRWHARPTTPGSAARSAPACPRCASITNGNPPPTREGERPVPVDGRVHRRGRTPRELRHLQLGVQRQDLRRRRAGARHLRLGVHEHHDPRRRPPHPGGHRPPAQEPVLAAVDRDQDRVDLRVRPAARTSCRCCRCSASTT